MTTPTPSSDHSQRGHILKMVGDEGEQEWVDIEKPQRRRERDREERRRRRRPAAPEAPPQHQHRRQQQAPRPGRPTAVLVRVDRPVAVDKAEVLRPGDLAGVEPQGPARRSAHAGQTSGPTPGLPRPTSLFSSHAVSTPSPARRSPGTASRPSPGPAAICRASTRSGSARRRGSWPRRSSTASPPRRTRGPARTSAIRMKVRSSEFGVRSWESPRRLLAGSGNHRGPDCSTSGLQLCGSEL